jgi:hypothetical protein
MFLGELAMSYGSARMTAGRAFVGVSGRTTYTSTRSERPVSSVSVPVSTHTLSVR